jgi:transposase InsO family protein
VTKGKKDDTKRIRALEKELNNKDQALAEAAALLVLKKCPRHLGRRGRSHSREQRQMILSLVKEAVAAGASKAVVRISARVLRMPRPTSLATKSVTGAGRPQQCASPGSFPQADLPQLADRGIDLASESTFYRVLKEHARLAHRQAFKPAVTHRPKAHVATGPCQVWSWDITYLKTSVKGLFFYLYMVLDVWSRKIMAAQAFAEESMEHSAMLVAEACAFHGVKPEELVLHSDNGGPMKGATMLATLHNLGVTPSFSRPNVSNDNPYSEALFRTMKYRPEYPSRPFETIEQAQSWIDQFVFWYNTRHLHSSIRFITPDDRHYGREQAILANRQKVYAEARQRNSKRWSKKTRNWNPVKCVWLNPEKIQADPVNDLKKAA